MRKSDFIGTGKVFSFTLAQYLKSKSTISMLVTMLVLSVASTLIMASSMGGVNSTGFNAGELRVMNRSGFVLDENDIAGFSDELSDIDITITESEFEGVFAWLEGDPYRAALLVEPDDYGSYSITTYTGEESGVNHYSTFLLGNALSSALTAARCRALGVSEEQLGTALAPFTVGTVDANEFLGSVTLPGNGSYLMISYAYSLIVMVLVMFSTTYIVRSIAEEKASKLVELLMVSVRPLALILGKILATMCFMIVSMLVLFTGAGLSSVIANRFMGMSLSTEMLAAAGINISFAGAGVLLVIVFVFSILLGYLAFSILGGIAGATCSSMEDMGPANTIVTLLALGGYMSAIFTAIIGSRTLLIVCSLLPFISIFTAPISFASGVIGFPLLCLSWALQIVVIIATSAFGARVYGALIIYRGNRIKLRQLFRIARESRKGAGA